MRRQIIQAIGDTWRSFDHDIKEAIIALEIPPPHTGIALVHLKRMSRDLEVLKIRYNQWLSTDQTEERNFDQKLTKALFEATVDPRNV